LQQQYEEKELLDEITDVMKEARSQGGVNGGNFPPNSESCTKNFQVNQAFDV